MKSVAISRRHVLRGIGGVAIALPLLEAMGCVGRVGDGAPPGGQPPPAPPRPTGADGGGAMSPDAARYGASDAAAPLADAAGADAGPTAGLGPRKRFLAMIVPHGTIPDLWFPTGGEADFALAPIMQPLAPHRRDVIVLQGVDNKVSQPNHFAATVTYFTGRPAVGATEQSLTSTGISVDQVIARALAANPSTRTRFASLELGTNDGGGGIACASYADAAMPLPKIGVASHLFDRLFSGDGGAAALVRARRQSVLDGALAELRALQTRVGAADRQRLEAHITSLREVEQRLTTTSACGPGGVMPSAETDDRQRLPAMMRSMIDVLVLALSCDLTRVATYFIRQEGAYSALTFGWLGIGPPDDPYQPDPRPDDQNQSHHSMSHYDNTPDNRDRLTRVGQWYLSQFVYLIERLKATPDGPGGATLFDGTVALYGSALAKGDHTTASLPYLLAGSAGGYFRTGRALRFDHASHNDLHVSLLNAMGVPATTFGDPAHCTGPLPGLR